MPWFQEELNLDMQPQQQSEWCWAATATSVNHFYNPSSQLTQCWLATVTFIFWWQDNTMKPAENTGDVCSDPANGNLPWGLQNYSVAPSPLQLAGNNYAKDFSGPDTFSGVFTQITLGQPVCVEIAWAGGGNHYVAIDGYTEWVSPIILPGPFGVPHDQWVHIEDPAYGPSDVAYGAFTDSYQGQGSWLWTVYTQSG